MQQNDIIFLHFIHDTLCNDAGIICLPVERIDVPQHLDHFCLIIEIAFPAAVRRSDILRMFSGQSKNNLVRFVHLLHRRLIREIGKIHMFIGMNADEMSVCMDFLHDLGIFFTLRTQKKKKLPSHSALSSLPRVSPYDPDLVHRLLMSSKDQKF